MLPVNIRFVFYGSQQYSSAVQPSDHLTDWDLIHQCRYFLKKNYKQIISRIFVRFKTAVCADYAAVKLQIIEQTSDSVVSVAWPQKSGFRHLMVSIIQSVVLFIQSGQRPVAPSQNSDWWFVLKFETPTKCNIGLNDEAHSAACFSNKLCHCKHVWYQYQFLLTTLSLPFVCQDENVDLRQMYLSVAALSGFVSFKSLLHTAFTVSAALLFFCFCFFFQDEQSAYIKRLQNKWRIQCATSFCQRAPLLSVFQLFDKEDRGSLSAEELSDLMGALLGVPQHNTAELYTQASDQGRLTEGERLMHQPPWEFSLI